MMILKLPLGHQIHDYPMRYLEIRPIGEDLRYRPHGTESL